MSIEDNHCESVEDAIILGTILNPEQRSHMASCVHCQGTIHMTKTIKDELEVVPSNQANKPLWIRELHARKDRARRRTLWTLGGAGLAAAAATLFLVAPRLVAKETTQTSSDDSAVALTQHGASRPSEISSKNSPGMGSSVRVTLEVADADNQAAAYSPTSQMLLQLRLSKTFSHFSLQIHDEALQIDIHDSRTMTEVVSLVNRLLETPLGEVSFSLAIDGSMRALCERVSTDARASELGIEVGIDSWTLFGDDEEQSHERCFLGARDLENTTGQPRPC